MNLRNFFKNEIVKKNKFLKFKIKKYTFSIHKKIYNHNFTFYS